jgi:hypothetical protein
VKIMKMNRNHKTWTVLALTAFAGLGLAGCQRQLDELPANEIQPLRPPRLLPPPAPYSIHVRDHLEFPVLEPTQHEFQVNVPPPGTPVVTIDNLPAGAVFDAAAMSLTWTPTTQDAQDPAVPGQYFRFHPITIRVSSSEDPLIVVSKTVTLVIQATRGDVTLDVPAAEMFEGQEGSQEIVVRSQDFPNGPFDVSSNNLPGGARIESVAGDPTRFRVKYTAGFDTVNTSDSLDASTRTYYKSRSLAYLVTLPNGVRKVATGDLKIWDRRLPPLISSPLRLTRARTSIEFIMRADDQNGEVIPAVSFLSPPFGRIEVTTLQESMPLVPGTRSPYKTVLVRWLDVPASSTERITSLEPLVCVRSTGRDMDLCDSTPIDVTIPGEVTE